jgi:3-oxoacyl-[acyl-carrier protein] reductase
MAWGRIDTLVNNAGIVQDAQFRKMSDDQFDRVVDVNLKGVYNCTKAVVDIVLEQNSMHPQCLIDRRHLRQFRPDQLRGNQVRRHRHGQDLGARARPQGIRANAICPGFIHTPILASMPDKVVKMMEDRVPLGRLGQPRKSRTRRLASDEASYISSAVIEVSGGATI